MTDAEHLSTLEPETRARAEALLAWSQAQGQPLEILSARRSCDDQNAIYAQGRTIPGDIVTGVRGCRSWHVHGRAFDVYAGSWDPQDYEAIGRVWRELGGVWGGAWRDYGHFEYHPGLTIDAVCPDPDQCATPIRLAVVGGALLGVGGVAAALYVVLRRR